nr:hypothetical protein K-LCC10_0274 [Kaumoebavirus]
MDAIQKYIADLLPRIPVAKDVEYLELMHFTDYSKEHLAEIYLLLFRFRLVCRDPEIVPELLTGMRMIKEMSSNPETLEAIILRLTLAITNYQNLLRLSPYVPASLFEPYDQLEEHFEEKAFLIEKEFEHTVRFE